MSTLTPQDHKYLKQLLKFQETSRCIKAQVGCIVVKNGKILVQDLNNPDLDYDCNKIGCIRRIRHISSGTQREICYGLCAEQNAFAQAARKGIKLKGATIYVTSHPCRICESMIADIQLKKVIYIRPYTDVLPKYNVLRKAGIPVIQAKEYFTPAESKKPKSV